MNAGTFIDKPKGTTEVVEYSDFKSLIDIFMNVHEQWKEQTAKMLSQPDTYGQLMALHALVKHSIQFNKKLSDNTLCSPEHVWHIGFTNAPSLSLLMGSFLHCLGIPFKYRFVWYDSSKPESAFVYPVAIVNGKEVVMDTAFMDFDTEKPYWKCMDRLPLGE
jgi:hypothetical protein